MIHFVYLVGFALVVSLIFGVISNGSTRDKVLYGAKTFAQFLIISLILAWIFYYIPF